MTLVKLITKRRWTELEGILSSFSRHEEIKIDNREMITEESTLHFALRYGAPLRIIRLLNLRYPKCIGSTDPTGKGVCHVAAKYCAEPKVVQFLLARNRDAAGTQDKHLKCPIHYCAEFYPRRNESETMLQVVRLLRDAAPRSFILEDDMEMNAIEYAILNDADRETVTVMQKATKNICQAIQQGETRLLSASRLSKRPNMAPTIEIQGQ